MELVDHGVWCMTAYTRDLDRPHRHHDYLPYSTPEACGGRQDRVFLAGRVRTYYTRYDLVGEDLLAGGGGHIEDS